MAWAENNGMFGHCYVEVGQDTWGSPVFEHPDTNNLSHAGADQDGFRQAVRAEVAVPDGTQIYCSYSAQRKVVEEGLHEMQVAKGGVEKDGHWRTIAWAPPAPPPKPSGPPVADEVPAALQAMLAADPYFAVPKGNGGAIERIDKHSTGSGADLVTVTQRIWAQQEGNLCRANQKIVMHQRGMDFTMEGTGQSWAGLVPLTMASRTSAGDGAEYSKQQVVSLRHEGDALFPLRQGVHSVLALEAEVRNGGDKVVSRDLRLDCRAGATVPASSLVATATGEATELQCTSTQPSLPAAPALEVMYHWFADAGCFVNAPIRL